MTFSTRLPLSSLIQLCRALRHNLSAGLMLRDIFRQQAKRGTPALRVVADHIAESLDEGDSLDAALQKEKESFPPLFLSLAGVGEETGNMPEIFGELENYYEMQQRFWRQFLSQCFLPILQFVAATLIIAGLLVILGLIANINNSQPIAPIGFGLTGGRGASIFLSVIYGSITLLFLIYVGASRSLEQKAVVDRLLLKMPAVGPFLWALSLARFSMALRLTLDSAMPIVAALTLSLKATGNAAFAAKAPVVQEALRSGDSLSEALTRCRLFPDEFMSMIIMGEEGGRVPEIMAHQSKLYQEEAAQKLTLLTRMSGFAVWFFVAALISLAIFKIAGIYMNALNGAMNM